MYDLIIVGGGPAGLSAAIYASRYKLKTIVFSKTMGGLAATAHRVCNYPSYKEIKGYELMQKFQEQVKDLGVETIYEEIKGIEKTKKGFKVIGEKNYEGKKIIYAGGSRRQMLKVPGEGKFAGRGISYCATCDAAFYKNKKTIVVGGSDAALTAALLLAEFTTDINIIYRGKEFSKADPTWVEMVKKNKNIKVIFNEELTEVMGDKKLEEVKLKSGKKMKCDGIFVEIGSIPETDILKKLNVRLTDNGYVIVDINQKTNVRGLYAAGDVTNNSLKQIITASSGGSIAAYMAYKEISEEKCIGEKCKDD